MQQKLLKENQRGILKRITIENLLMELHLLTKIFDGNPLSKAPADNFDDNCEKTHSKMI